MDVRTLVKQEIQKLQRVLDILDAGSPRTGRQQVKTTRTMSAAARKRISDAQRKRWAKVRAGKK